MAPKNLKPLIGKTFTCKLWGDGVTAVLTGVGRRVTYDRTLPECEPTPMGTTNKTFRKLMDEGLITFQS